MTIWKNSLIVIHPSLAADLAGELDKCCVSTIVVGQDGVNVIHITSIPNPAELTQSQREMIGTVNGMRFIKMAQVHPSMAAADMARPRMNPGQDMTQLRKFKKHGWRGM